MKGLEELFKRKLKEKGPISDKEQKARDSVYNELEDVADHEMAKPLMSAKVMAPNKEGLEEGLEKAKEIVAKDGEAEEEMSEMDEDSFEDKEDSDKEMSKEEIMKMMDMLNEKLAKM